MLLAVSGWSCSRPGGNQESSRLGPDTDQVLAPHSIRVLPVEVHSWVMVVQRRAGHVVAAEQARERIAELQWTFVVGVRRKPAAAAAVAVVAAGLGSVPAIADNFDTLPLKTLDEEYTAQSMTSLELAKTLLGEGSVRPKGVVRSWRWETWTTSEVLDM